MGNTDKKSRPPIIVIMGHIDHGKTSLLDYIRETKITDKEVGGITQHTSAYEVRHTPKTTGEERKITFIDTPGHEAFASMRSRGATIADIAVLIVSAVEGPQVQTIEAYKAIKDAEIPFIVAINKIDKPEADIERTKQALAQHEIFLESYGGTVPFAPISAKTGKGVSELIDLMLLVADMEDLKGNPAIPAEGVVIESHLDPKRGASATLIIKNGTLERGMFLIFEDVIAPVRIFEDFLGKNIDTATFSSPIRIAGMPKVPQMGSMFVSAHTKKNAETILATCKASLASSVRKPHHVVSEGQAGKIVIPLVIKTDVLGTLEAIEHEIRKIETNFAEHFSIMILASGAGTITENDVRAATSSGTDHPIVIGFNVKVDRAAIDAAEKLGITVKSFSIIYEIQKYLTEELTVRTPKVEVEETLGKVRILRVFSQTKDKQIIGGTVLSGSIVNGKQVKILRHEREIGQGEIVELQQQKNKVKEVVAPNQFGTMVESRTSIAEGDTLEIFDVVTK